MPSVTSNFVKSDLKLISLFESCCMLGHQIIYYKLSHNNVVLVKAQKNNCVQTFLPTHFNKQKINNFFFSLYICNLFFYLYIRLAGSRYICK